MSALHWPQHPHKEGKEMADTASKKAASEKPKTLRVVKYVGTADERVIRPEDWANVDITHDGAKWFVGNNWQIDASRFSDDCLNYFENEDDGFVIVDVAVDLSPAKTEAPDVVVQS